MYFEEGIHELRPHFHAVYAGQLASFDIEDLSRLSGRLPLRIERLVRVWAREHRDELLRNWQRGRAGLTFKDVPPLK
jgi:hypothetical protein